LVPQNKIQKGGVIGELWIHQNKIQKGEAIWETGIHQNKIQKRRGHRGTLVPPKKINFK
jgi:hypothetical protein